MSAKLRQSLIIWLINKIQKFGPHRVKVLGNTYEISENVFNPGRYYTSKLMAGHINVKPSDKILDMGTGSGIQAITAARSAQEVIAVDINPEAVRCAEKNIRANGFEGRVSVMEGDLFSPLGPEHKFDVILFTPPYFEGTPETVFECALIDPDKLLIKKFFGAAKEYLTPHGYVQMLYSSIADAEGVLQIIHDLGWEHSLLVRKRTLTETFFIYKLRPANGKGHSA
ncbi:MAG: methyltransferase [Nitrospirae bacterium]|nr:methyltransferase [Nitrospirota bacterium]